VTSFEKTLSGVVDRSTVRVHTLHDEPDDRGWWWARSPLERLAAIEVMPTDCLWTRRCSRTTSKSS
jgi:hypothetical protein